MMRRGSAGRRRRRSSRSSRCLPRSAAPSTRPAGSTAARSGSSRCRATGSSSARCRPTGSSPGCCRPARGDRRPITGSQIDERSLGQVPSAAYADVAGAAQTAIDAQTALNAVNAVDADTVNGHGAGCLAGTGPSPAPAGRARRARRRSTAPVAAAACAAQGGTLPEALQLAAFAQQPDIELDGDEWSSDITNCLWSERLRRGHGFADRRSRTSRSSTNTRHYRCVIPIVV